MPDCAGRARWLYCGATPAPPAKQIVSPSNETGERNIDEACYGSSSAATTRGGSAAFARAVGNTSRGLCEAPYGASEHL
jgi:hypothetical protein